MCKDRAMQSLRRDSGSPENEAQTNSHDRNDENSVAENDPSPGPPQPALQLQPPPQPTFAVLPSGLSVWTNEQYFGNLLLGAPLDLSQVHIPAGHYAAVNIDGAKLVIPSQWSIPQANSTPTPTSAPAPTPGSAPTPTRPAKRKAAEDKTPKPNKAPKRVAKNARPVPPKPASAYAKAVEEPRGMTKNEEDSCLTCIKNNRKCGGTQLHMVKGAKRCQNCAFPGKGSCGRVCYWPDKRLGIRTFEDAVEKMGKKLGGRRLPKNTRKGRLERQGEAGDTTSDGVEEDASRGGNALQVADDLEETDEPEDGVDPGDAHSDEEGHEDFNDPDLASAVATAHGDLYRMVGSDLGYPEGAHSTVIQLSIERRIRGALEGWDPLHDLLEGIPDAVLASMARMVNTKITQLEQALKKEE